MWGKIGETNWDFEAEGAGQFGTVGSENIGAGMFTTVLGYTFPVKDLSPRACFEFDYASGDKKRGEASALSISSTRTVMRFLATSTISGGKTSSVQTPASP